MKDYGCVSRRKNGTYMGRVRYKGMQKTFYGTSQKSVQNDMNDFVMQAMYGGLTSQRLTKFGEYCSSYLYTYKYPQIKPSSFDRLESTCKCHVIGTEIDIPVYQLDDTLLQNYLAKKAKKYSKSTVKKIYDLLKSVLYYAYRKKDIDLDIGSFLSCPKVEKETNIIQPYTDEEIALLVSGIEEKIQSKDSKDMRRYRYAPAYLMIYETGLRASELLALKKEDIDLENRMIKVHKGLAHVKARDKASDTVFIDILETPKTDAGLRFVPISNKCYQYIMYLLMDDIDSEYLVHNLKGECMKLRSIEQTYERICKELGVTYRGLHALRHTFASVLIRKKVNANVVSKMLGHTSVKFTYDRYVHPSVDEYKEAIKMLD